jgi:hypothetical protein
MQVARAQAPLRQSPAPETGTAAERCRNCGCEHARRRFKRRDLCGKCFYLFECIRGIERWDRVKPETLKNIGLLRRRFGGLATPLDRMSDQDFAAIKSNYLDQLGAALRGLRSREERRRGEVRVDGLTIEGKLKDILKVVQLRDSYDRVAGRFSGVATLLDRAFSPEQCRLLYNLLDDIEEQTYGQVTEGHKAFEAVYQNRTPDRPTTGQEPKAESLSQPTTLPADGPNDLWLVDFRHRLRSAEGWLYPVVAFDAHTRCIVLQAICASNGAEALKDRLAQAFREHGMPKRIAVRHGHLRSTFSPLEVWLIEHDIAVDQSARNQTGTFTPFDGLLRSLRAELLDRSFSTFTAAEDALAQWGARMSRATGVSEVGGAPRSGGERIAARPYVDEVAPFEYEPHDIVRRVQERGRISLFGRIVRVPKSFRGKDVAFRPTLQNGVLDVLFRAQKFTTIKVRSGSPQTGVTDLHAGIGMSRSHFQSGGAALPDRLHSPS